MQYLTSDVADLVLGCTAGLRCGIRQFLVHHWSKYEVEKADLAVQGGKTELRLDHYAHGSLRSEYSVCRGEEKVFSLSIYCSVDFLLTRFSLMFGLFIILKIDDYL